MFDQNEHDIVAGRYSHNLLDVSRASTLVKILKSFGRIHAYEAIGVRRLELEGTHAIRDLMDDLWKGITAKESHPTERIKDPFPRYAYSRISEGYRRSYESSLYSPGSLSPRYYSLQLLADMISGMTDNYLLELRNELKELRHG